MNASRLLVLAVLMSACGRASALDRMPTTATEAALQEADRKTSTDAEVNPDAAVMSDFKKRVEGYVALQRKLAKGDADPQKNSSPAEALKRYRSVSLAGVRLPLTGVPGTSGVAAARSDRRNA